MPEGLMEIGLESQEDLEIIGRVVWAGRNFDYANSDSYSRHFLSYIVIWGNGTDSIDVVNNLNARL